MSATVSFQLIDNYEPENLNAALHNLLEPLGGYGGLITDDSSVVIKPNLLAPRPLSRAVCTHPEVVRQFARLARDGGATRVLVTDSPGIGTTQQVAAKLGLTTNDVLEVVSPEETEWVHSKEAGMWKLHLSVLMRRHPVVNIAKAKTHGQMIVSAAVKNMFGAVVGLEKAQWHYRIGREPLNFGKLLVHIYEMVRPKVNIIDGIVGMEGNGPGSGTPRALGFLAASTNAHALDYILCKIWKVNPMSVYTLRAAKEAGLLPDEKDIYVIGADVASLHPNPDWKMAVPASVGRLVGPNWMIPLWERLFKTVPKVNTTRCTMCFECIHHCAAGAMEAVGGQIQIDTQTCISCFCCQEMCPHGAITIDSGVLARWLRLGKD
ncbi:MAG: DUF362 domain-containing protein [Deltaproteobacteria bacterium]|nr:DUF362 domain-containing protein [Deltaproteobacteria bacterium]MBN2670540.1 DUF362 domain-containing protein [Deltaproteobacteria bacterium]